MSADQDTFAGLTAKLDEREALHARQDLVIYGLAVVELGTDGTLRRLEPSRIFLGYPNGTVVRPWDPLK